MLEINVPDRKHGDAMIDVVNRSLGKTFARVADVSGCRWPHSAASRRWRIFVKPTLFVDIASSMTIAREGVLSTTAWRSRAFV
jgi:hypothetical protein